MTPRVHRVLSGLSLAALATVAVGSTASPALAASGDVEVVNTETVQIYTSPTGSVEESRVYEQLSMFGNGAVDVKNPVSTDGLRNLDGFGGFDVENGDQVIKTTVDGTEKVRTVSSYDGKLPLDVRVAYKLDGKSVEPGDVVGGNGKLEVVYTVENITGKSQEVTVPDGRGGTVTKTAEVSIPIVGSLTTTAPASFTNVESEQANRAGDGKGGTKLSFTMTLFPPIGSPTAVFGYTADIKDGVIPRADISALPVNPLDVPTFKSANASYQGGADTGAKLTDGAVQIDDNLLKLRDGAGDLLAGLIKLRDGASELNAGLSGKAAPGAQKLATGAGDLNDGLGQIDDGAGQLTDGTGAAAAGARKLGNGLLRLATGAGDLSDGVGQLSDGGTRLSNAFNSPTGDADFVTGSKTLANGLGQISGGLGQLADAQTGLPAARQGVIDLRDGVDRIRAGISNPQCDVDNPQNPQNPCGLVQGLQALKVGLNNASPTKPGAIQGATLIEGGLTDLLSVDPAAPGLPLAKGGVDQINGQIAAAVANAGSIDELVGGLGAVKGFCAAIADPTTKAQCSGTVDAIIYKVNNTTAGDSVDSLREKLLAANGGLTLVSGGLGKAVDGVTKLKAGATSLKTGLQQADTGVAALLTGVGRLQAGLSNPGCDLDDPKNPSNPCGVREGLNKLEGGLTSAINGLGLLGPGSNQALAGATQLNEKLVEAGDGAGRLAAGLGKAKDGSDKLAAGAGDAADGGVTLGDGLGKLDAGAQKLADGVSKAFDGSGLLADGAQTLSDGLQDAANGSGRLAEGLGTAADGAPKLKNGAQKLSDQGTKKLIAAGESTTQSYGEMVAVMKAGAERADAEKMAYGAPADAVGLTAYSYVIQGDNGETGRNWARGLGGLALLGAGGGVFALRRRIL